MKNKQLSHFDKSFEESYFYKDYLIVLNEYKSLGIDISPKVWFSTEWFCPDGVEGVGVPFYLNSLNLMRYFESIGVSVEGKTSRERKKLFRHELAHVVDNVYGLRRLKKRQEIFGLSSQKYPEYFYPKKRLVKERLSFSHIDSFYWQSHPCEDFAETLSFVVENWSKIDHYKEDLKVKYIKGLIDSGDVFSKKNKYALKKTEIESISDDDRTVEEYIEEYFSQVNVANRRKIFSASGEHSLEDINLEEKTWAKQGPWILDNFRQIITYQKNYLGRKTIVSKKTKRMIESGDRSFFKSFDLNKVYM